MEGYTCVYFLYSYNYELIFFMAETIHRQNTGRFLQSSMIQQVLYFLIKTLIRNSRNINTLWIKFYCLYHPPVTCRKLRIDKKLQEIANSLRVAMPITKNDLLFNCVWLHYVLAYSSNNWIFRFDVPLKFISWANSTLLSTCHRPEQGCLPAHHQHFLRWLFQLSTQSHCNWRWQMNGVCQWPVQLERC